MSRPKIGVVIHTALRKRLFKPEDIERLEYLGDVRMTASGEPIGLAEAESLLSECEIGVGSWGTPYPSAELLPRLPKLRLWMHVAGTLKFMFGPHLEGSEVMVASCVPANSDNTAEFALGLIILGARRAIGNAEANRQAVAPKPDGIRTAGSSVVGIVGASQIGRRVIRGLQFLGAEVKLYDPYVPEGEAKELGVEKFEDLADLCAHCDVVSLHTPNLPSTRHIMGAREFQAMRDDAVFVNTSRGACADEEALIAELEKGRLLALLDVTLPEPAAADSALRRLPNVHLFSHIGGPPDFRLGRHAVDNIEVYLNGGRPDWVVTSDMLDLMA